MTREKVVHLFPGNREERVYKKSKGALRVTVPEILPASGRPGNLCALRKPTLDLVDANGPEGRRSSSLGWRWRLAPMTRYTVSARSIIRTGQVTKCRFHDSHSRFAVPRAERFERATSRVNWKEQNEFQNSPCEARPMFASLIPPKEGMRTCHAGRS